MQQANPQERFDLPAAGEPPVCEAWISYCLQQNWSIFPLIGGTDVQRGKRPALRWEPFMRQHPAPSDLQKWSDMAAYGVVCGDVSRLVVLDLDDANLATRFWQRFPDLMQTFVVRSGTRGTPHIYWRVDFPVKTRQFPDADLKAEGGYVVGPGSMIADAQWQVSVHQPVRTISRAELDAVLVFLRPVTSPEPLREPLADVRSASSDYPTIYRALVNRLAGRNQALFTTARYMRDAGHTQARTIQQLAGIHAHQSAVNSACSEPYSRRYAEAVRTIASVYSRPARRSRSSETTVVSYYPNAVREVLLSRSDGAAIGRTLEGAILQGVQPGTLVTEPLLCRLLNGIVSRETIRKALRATDEEGLPIFGPPENPPADAEIPDGMARQKDAFLSGGQKQTKPARQYLLPTPDALCQALNVPNKGSDPIALDDVRSSRQYRQALHRGLLKRRPGIYAQPMLAARLGICARTVRRYNRTMPVQSTPTYDETPVFWLNLDQIPQAADIQRYQIEVRGQFLLDESGKRWPVKREIAAQLLQRGQRVSHMRQRANYYWYDEMAWKVTNDTYTQTKCRHADTYRPPVRVLTDAMPVRDVQPDPVLVSQERPDSAREGRSTPFSGDEVVATANSRPCRSKRRFKRALTDAVAERAAQRTYTAIDRLSLPNARRLVDTYGSEPVLAALRKLDWLREHSTVRNAPGLLVTMARSCWRARHDQPAPHFVAEPVRRSRRLTYVAPQDDSLWQSSAYRQWRHAFFGLDDEPEALAF